MWPAGGCGQPAGVVSQWVEPQQEQISRRKTRYQSVIMACLMAAWSIHNPTVTNSIIMVSTPPGLDRSQTGLDWTWLSCPFGYHEVTSCLQDQ